MTKNMLAAALSTVVFLGGCGGEPGASETPGEALQAIIDLYESRDFDALIRDRYAEIGKAESEEQIRALIDRFAKRYADEEACKQAIALYRSLLSTSPKMAEEGDVATYVVDEGEAFVKLSRMPNGKWGFHL